MMGPTIRRQYGSRDPLLNHERKRNQLWWHSSIGLLPPRSVPLASLAPMGAHSYAQGRGHIASLALLPYDISVATHLTPWFVGMAISAEGESPIYLSELAATVLTACLVAYRSDGNPRTCVLRVDNKAALAALITGSSSPALGDILDNFFWGVASRGPVVWRFEYVNTKSNAADPPSRLCDAPSGSMRSRSPGEIPPEFFGNFLFAEYTPSWAHSV